MIVAWHGVPGTASTERTRPVGYGLIGHSYPQPSQRFFWPEMCAHIVVLRKFHSNHHIGAHAGTNQTVPYGTALFDGGPRHFVPSYDRTVPPGQKRSPIEGPRIKLALAEVNPGLCFLGRFGPRIGSVQTSSDRWRYRHAKPTDSKIGSLHPGSTECPLSSRPL
jgi:hypothetical protein